MDQFGAEELGHVMWALGTLEYDPGREWMAAALARTESNMRAYVTAAPLVHTLWALARLKHQPPASWMFHILWQVRRGGLLVGCGGV